MIKAEYKKAVENNIQILEHVKRISNKINNDLEMAIFAHAVPKIKGELTKGKLQWRGIKLCSRMDGFKRYQWIEQRGKRISPEIVFEIKIQ